MNRVIIGVLALAILFTGLYGVSKTKDLAQKESMPVVSVVEKNGFMTLDIKDRADNTTVIAKVVPNDKAKLKINNGDFVVQNMFDEKDVIVLDKEYKKSLKQGDVVLVTFNQDIVEKVEKNKYNVENKIIGQEIAY